MVVWWLLLLLVSHQTPHSSSSLSETASIVVVAAASNEAETTPKRAAANVAKGISTPPPQSNQYAAAQRQIDWVRSKGGFFSEKIALQQRESDHDYENDDDDDNGGDYNAKNGMGVFAVDNVQSGEVVMLIPKSLMLRSIPMKPGENWQGSPLDCGSVRRLYQEMKLGNASEFEPYVSYLMTQSFGVSPSAYSDAAKALFLKIVGPAYKTRGRHLLPPVDPVGWIEQEYTLDCEGSDDPMEQQAALLVIQRGWDDILCPLYDMLNHRNGDFLNTASNSVHDCSDNFVEIRATQYIPKGEELYSSYSQCRDCSNRAADYGTPEVFRDYGFVERYPQKFVFHDYNVAFLIEPKYRKGDERSTITSKTKMKDIKKTDLVVTWNSADGFELPDEETMLFFHKQLKRLRKVGRTHMTNKPDEVTLHEWTMLKELHSSFVLALEMVEEQTTMDSCADDDMGQCSMELQKYDPLNSTFVNLGHDTTRCNFTTDWTLPDYIEALQSPHHHEQPDDRYLQFRRNPNTGDICHGSGTKWNICASYRYHYNENMVHHAARFLPRVERVLFVGGGESMLLHEIVKYPALELVLGLEQDQAVTRSCFQHFETQPHFDNDKVQWWFGDLVQSLLLLPNELYGSFDLVVADVPSETLARSATEDMVVVEMLSLLLKPQGIFVKSESNHLGLQRIFKHSVQTRPFAMPMMCSLAFAFGSNQVDFFGTNLTDHGVDDRNLVALNFSQAEEHPYVGFHDYVLHPEHWRRTCKNITVNSNENSTRGGKHKKHTSALLMIIEAENAQAQALATTAATQNVIVSAVQQQGMTVVSTAAWDGDTAESTPMVAILLQEGYVMARTWAERRYCAFDVYLWSRFSQLDGIKHALVSAVKSDAPSSFRMVVAGMFNTSSWRDDEQSHGPQHQQEDCDVVGEEHTVSTKQQRFLGDFEDNSIFTTNYTFAETVVRESIRLRSITDVTVVVCGRLDDQSCRSAYVSSNDETVHYRLQLQMCKQLRGCMGFESDENYGFAQTSCEQDVFSLFFRAFRSMPIGVTTNLVILDPTAGLPIAQVIHNLARQNPQYFSKSLMVLAVMADEEPWRRHFLDKFRELHVSNNNMTMALPTYRAEVVFTNPQSGGRVFELGVFMSGSAHFVKRLHNVTQNLAAKTGLVGTIRKVHGGIVPKFVSIPSLRELSPPLQLPDVNGTANTAEATRNNNDVQQWESPHILGHQTIFQFEMEEKYKRIRLQTSTTRLSCQKILDLSRSALTAMNLTSLDSNNKTNSNATIGNGCVAWVAWDGGNAAFLWDGQHQFSLNIFLLFVSTATGVNSTTRDYEELANQFAGQFPKLNPLIKLVTQNTFPRGYGRVVSFGNLGALHQG